MGRTKGSDPWSLYRSESLGQESIQRGTLVLEERLHNLDNRIGMEEGAGDSHAETREDYHQALDRLPCLDYKDYIAKNHDEEGRAGRLLAWWVAVPTREKPITQILTDDGLLLYSPKDINNTFQTYYEQLYNHPGYLPETAD
ncbi:hypothetical protein NDU88_000455 [Pleurodeles waltl]|uniref:Uncharacterized protein n=1 Tax=Pleurodeles waltl TaxID=8319 RepID=A0AAV7SWH0_PLEWA|nr:hypothetical protein NDU88_000455 [Pleurodeles waltl]